jgi:drug/metabolite transporter (DMT)-like permease
MMIVASFMVAGAQILFKLASARRGPDQIIFFDPLFWLGIGAYFAALVFSLRGFQLGHLSLAAPFLGLAYVWTTLVGVTAYHDPVTWLHLSGLILVLVGAWLLAGDA